MILQQHHYSPVVTVEEEQYFLHSPHLTFPAADSFATTSSLHPHHFLQQTMQLNDTAEPRKATKPIDIHSPQVHQPRYNTAPSALHMSRPHSPSLQWAGMSMRPLAAAQPTEPMETSEEEQRPRVTYPKKVCPIKSPAISKVSHTRNDLNVYRERILNEAMLRRRQQEAEEQQLHKEQHFWESEKENAESRSRSRKRLCSEMSGECCFGFEGTSTNCDEFLDSTELDDGIASCDEESDADEGVAQVPDSSSSHFWDTDDESTQMPVQFNSVADIIGYAKVVRAQRNEALGKLNNQIQQFSDTWTVMRGKMEETVKSRSQPAEQDNCLPQ